MRRSNLKALLAVVVSALILVGSGTALAAKPPGTTNGTTLQASKTIDVCVNSDGSYTYSGVVSVWNEGALATQGLSIVDCVQNKVSGPVWTDNFCQQLRRVRTRRRRGRVRSRPARRPVAARSGRAIGRARRVSCGRRPTIGTPRFSLSARHGSKSWIHRLAATRTTTSRISTSRPC